MKHRIITSVIALSLLATMPAWGQTNVIRRGQTEAEKAHADRQRRQAAERARREEAERIRIEKLEAEAEIEKQEIAKGGLLVVDDNPLIDEKGTKYFDAGDFQVYQSSLVAGIRNGRKDLKGDIVLPKYIKIYGHKHPLVFIDDYTFKDCKNITSVIIPEGVESIKSHVFEGCSSLVSVVLPPSISSIGDYAFASCENLTSINLPTSLQRIYDGAFKGCKKLGAIEFPSSVDYIGKRAFYGCSVLSFSALPSSLTFIKEEAFECCDSLKEIKLPPRVKEIGEYAFCYCTHLTKFELSEELLPTISENTFHQCMRLDYLTVYAEDGKTRSVNNYYRHWK